MHLFHLVNRHNVLLMSTQWLPQLMTFPLWSRHSRIRSFLYIGSSGKLVLYKISYTCLSLSSKKSNILFQAFTLYSYAVDFYPVDTSERFRTVTNKLCSVLLTEGKVLHRQKFLYSIYSLDAIANCF